MAPPTPPLSLGYRGKALDGLPAVLRMVCARCFGSPPPHSETLTTRPFAHRVVLDDPRRWLEPFVGAWEGLHEALGSLGLRRECAVTEAAGDEHGSVEMALEWSAKGPVVLGPLDALRLWGRLEARYFAGATSFIVVLGPAPRGRLRIHDPEGWPHSHISPARLAAALATVPGPAGIVRLPPHGSFPLRAELLHRVLEAGWRARRAAAAHPEGGAGGIEALARRLESGALRSSEEAALRLALPEFGVARWRVAELLDEFPSAGAISVAREARCGVVLAARAVQTLRAGSGSPLRERLLALAAHERRLDALLESHPPAVSSC